MFKFLYLTLALLLLAGCSTPHQTIINLAGWSQQGPVRNGTWVVSEDQTSVAQVDNGLFSFFVSPEAYSRFELEGTLTVETSSDDDLIGLVFGYHGPQATTVTDSIDCDFILFDWKQYDQSGAREGFTIAHMQGRFPNVDSEALPFWTHRAEAGFDTLKTLYGKGLGWQDGMTYHISIRYTPDVMDLTVQSKGQGATSTLTFSVDGHFPPGRIGFYNYSQPKVRYELIRLTPL